MTSLVSIVGRQQNLLQDGTGASHTIRQHLSQSNLATTKNADTVFTRQRETALVQFRAGTSGYFGVFHLRTPQDENMECRWCVAGITCMKQTCRHHCRNAHLSHPTPPAYVARRGSDPVLCSIWYDCLLRRKQLWNHTARTHKIRGTAELSKLLYLTLHRSPPGGLYRCPLRTFLTENRLFFVKHRVLHHGPVPPDTPTPVKNIRIIMRRLSTPPAVARSPPRT
jgi:hypothetical protein